MALFSPARHCFTDSFATQYTLPDCLNEWQLGAIFSQGPNVPSVRGAPQAPALVESMSVEVRWPQTGLPRAAPGSSDRSTAVRMDPQRRCEGPTAVSWQRA
jgi:hypothetical protein